MISPKTAPVSALLEVSSSVGAFDFAGEPDPSHNGLNAFTLHFEALFCFTVLDLEALIFLVLPLKASFFFMLLFGACSPTCVLALSTSLSGLPLQQVNDHRLIATGT